MERDFSDALLGGGTPRIIGVPMRPFSFGHALFLERVESSFVCGVFPTYDDLIATAFICAHDWQDNQRLMRSPLRRWLMLKLWGKLAGKFNIAAAVLALHRYVKDGMEFPDVVQKEGMRALAMPHSARLYTFLRSSGLSELEAMNLPMRAANLIYCAEQERHGHLELVSDTFREMVRRGQGGAA